MHPLNDKDLDRLSREAAEQYDVGSSATGWDLVENRLNTEMPVKAEKEKRRFLFWLFFIALMAGGGLVYMLGGNKTNTSIAQQKVGTTSASSTSSKQENSTATNTSKAVASQTDKNTKDISTDNTVVTPSARRSNEIISSKTIANKAFQGPVNKNSINKLQIVPGHTVKSSARRNNPVKKGMADVAIIEPAVRDNSNQGKNGVIENNAEKLADNASVSKAQQPKDAVVAITANNNKSDVSPVVDNASTQKETAGKEDKKTPELTASTKKPISKTSTPIKSPLEIGIVVGPDQSYVKFKNGDNTGLNFGVQVGYRFSNRWSINTGLILEKKYYKADGEDFTSPKTDWTTNVKMNAIDGSCNMFDIPLNVRYDFSYNDKRRFFVSTGLTSYLMHHQTYDYYYTWPTSPPGLNYVKKWGTDSSMNYFMSVLNLSVGFERTLSKHFSFQAEPYLKIPLKGLGYGSMKMDSYGVFFSLKYKPEFGKKSSK